MGTSLSCCVSREHETQDRSLEPCQDQNQVDLGFPPPPPPPPPLDEVLKAAGVGVDGPVTRDHIESFCADEGRRNSVELSSKISAEEVEAMLMSVHETFEKEHHLHKFKQHDGFISAEKSMHVETMSVQAAKEHASVLKGCKGFCFNSAMTEGDQLVKVYFKNHFGTPEVGWTTWTSFEVCREDPPLDEFVERVSKKAQNDLKTRRSAMRKSTPRAIEAAADEESAKFGMGGKQPAKPRAKGGSDHHSVYRR